MKSVRPILTFAIFLCFGVCAEPIDSALATKGCELVEEPWMPTASDYIQDGLVIQYDGIENVGFGEHNSEAKKWIDLTGHGLDLPLTRVSFGEDCLQVVSNGWAMLAWSNGSQVPYFSDIRYHNPNYDKHLTIEIVVEATDPNAIYFSGFNETSLVTAIRSWVKGIKDTGTEYVTPKCFVADGLRHHISARFGDWLLEEFVDGEFWWQNTRYKNYGFFNDSIAIGRTRYFACTTCPWKMFAVRVYNRVLSDIEVEYNRHIDNWRFGL